MLLKKYFGSIKPKLIDLLEIEMLWALSQFEDNRRWEVVNGEFIQHSDDPERKGFNEKWIRDFSWKL